ncbi:MAG: hypothetical protein WBD86_01995 [Microgenomates group bacterium]
MGKTRTAVISGEPQPSKAGERKKKKQRKSLKEEKGIRIPGLKGGERVVAVTAEPLPKEEKTEKEKKIVKKERKTKVRGKKYKQVRAKINKTKLYPLSKALELVKETSYSSFDGTMELHLVVKKEGLSANIKLPHSAGKKKKIEIAKDTTIKKLEKGKVDFDILLATPEMMPKLVPFAKLLGPKGLMPNPKNGTLIKSASEAKKFSTNTITVKTEKKAPLIHTVIGKVNQKDKELVENAEAVLTGIGKRQIVKAYLCATMGPSVKIDFS